MTAAHIFALCSHSQLVKTFLKRGDQERKRAGVQEQEAEETGLRQYSGKSEVDQHVNVGLLKLFFLFM